MQSYSLFERRTSFCTGSLEDSVDSYLRFQLALLHSVLLLFPLSMTFLVVINGFLILFHLTLMRFCRLTNLLCLSLETLTSIIRTG